MRKILVLGDIHANYPALRAIRDYLRKYRFDRIVNTGDFTVYSTFPNETIRWFRKRKEAVCVLGNTDRRILRILKGKALKKPRKIEKRVMYYWTAKNLTSKNIEYLRGLPRKTDFTVGKVRIGVFHGTRDHQNEALFPGGPESRFAELAAASPFRVHIMGHSHTPLYRLVDGVHFVNPGSVGRMFDGDSRAAFAILKISSDDIEVEHFRIPYPIEEVVEGLKKNRLPKIYAKMYRAGKKLN